jgi:REP element-mobilizing transposase RayT
VTTGRAPVFRDLASGRAVVAALRALDTEGAAQTLAYVVMPNHLHWLLTLGEAVTLGRAVGLAKGRSARRVNGVRRELDEPAITPLWQAGYHDHAVRQDEDIRALAR